MKSNLFFFILLSLMVVSTYCKTTKTCSKGIGTKNGKSFALMYNNKVGSAESPWCANTYYGSPITFTRSWTREWEMMCFYHIDDADEFDFDNTNDKNYDKHGKCNWKDGKHHDHNNDGICDDNDNIINYGEEIAILSLNWNRFWSVEEDRSNIVHANREKAQDWESFKFVQYDDTDGKICDGEKVLLYSVQYSSYCYPRNEEFDNTLFCNYTGAVSSKGYFVINEINNIHCNKNPLATNSMESMEFVSSFAKAEFITDKIVIPVIPNGKNQTNNANLLSYSFFVLLSLLLL